MRVGSVVLKPVEDPSISAVIANVMAAVATGGFRVERPVAADGRWVVRSWTALTFLDGKHQLRGRAPDVLAVGPDFHRALAGQPATGRHCS